MKRLILPAALAFALSASLAFAQDAAPVVRQSPDAQQPAGPMHHHHHGRGPERETAHLTKVLNLTPDQAAKIEPILANRDQQMAALWSNQQLAPQDKHQQMKAIHQATEQQFASVLTPDQLQQMRAMHHGHFRHGGPDQAPAQGPPPAGV